MAAPRPSWTCPSRLSPTVSTPIKHPLLTATSTDLHRLWQRGSTSGHHPAAAAGSGRLDRSSRVPGAGPQQPGPGAGPQQPSPGAGPQQPPAARPPAQAPRRPPVRRSQHPRVAARLQRRDPSHHRQRHRHPRPRRQPHPPRARFVDVRWALPTSVRVVNSGAGNPDTHRGKLQGLSAAQQQIGWINHYVRQGQVQGPFYIIIDNAGGRAFSAYSWLWFSTASDERLPGSSPAATGAAPQRQLHQPRASKPAAHPSRGPQSSIPPPAAPGCRASAAAANHLHPHAPDRPASRPACWILVARGFGCSTVMATSATPSLTAVDPRSLSVRPRSRGEPRSAGCRNAHRLRFPAVTFSRSLRTSELSRRAKSDTGSLSPAETKTSAQGANRRLIPAAR
ncbi:MAG: hypothetical protein KatS3mg060_2754 [Dehalococcoidia bacterium]|nr:MAG: hypothetical protein KatS3mg060_2754 [Dehalococcoidia bacterium]